MALREEIRRAVLAEVPPNPADFPQRRIQGGISMKPRPSRHFSPVSLGACLLVLCCLASSPASADAIYTITDLGTLSGQSSSVATSINNLGQVVGISYDSSDGYFTPVYPASGNPPRFTQTGSGANSFLYSGGQMTQVSPIGGLAMSINDSGQVVGGQYSSVNNLGQYVGGQNAGVQTASPNTISVLVSSGGTTTLPSLFIPYSVNASGQVVGLLIADNQFHPGLYQNGQVTDLSPKAGGSYEDSRAVAINQNGDIAITAASASGTINSYLYNASTGNATELPSLAGSSQLLAAALNDKDQVVGNGFLYSNGTTQALTSLLPAGSGWSNLNATGINDSGQIVGQGTYDGQQVAFLMTPVTEAPEPGTLAIWGLITAFAVRQLAKGTAERRRAG